MQLQIANKLPHPVRYDAERRRLWIFGQRCHHGATGALIAAVGALLMVHDWKDHSVWFQLGPERHQ